MNKKIREYNNTFEELYQELIKLHGKKLGSEIAFEVIAEGYTNPIAVVSKDSYIENFTEVSPEELMKSQYIALTFKNSKYVINVKVEKLPLKTKRDYIKLISEASDRYGNKLVEMMNRYDAINLERITYEQAKQFYEEEMERLPF